MAFSIYLSSYTKHLLAIYSQSGLYPIFFLPKKSKIAISTLYILKEIIIIVAKAELELENI